MNSRGASRRFVTNALATQGADHASARDSRRSEPRAVMAATLYRVHAAHDAGTNSRRAR